MVSSTKMDKKTSKKPVNQQKAYKDTAEFLKKIQVVMNKAAREAGKQEHQRLLKSNPELVGKKIHFLPDNRCLPSAEIPFTEAYLKILDAMLFTGGSEKTQKEINEEVRKQFFPDKGKISLNIWTKPLEPWAIRNITTRIMSNMTKPVDITGCKTLGEIRRRLKVSQSDGGAVFQYSGKILVNKKVVEVGKASYPIMKRRKAYAIQIPINNDDGKRQWIRLDALLALLKNLKRINLD